MIFCVEDDANIRELILYSLQSTGFEAIGLCDHKELEQKLQEITPSLILLDVMLPEKDGFEIIKSLRSSPKTKNIPLIMLTAKSSEFDKVHGLDLGADDYITKPFGIMELVARVKALLRRSNPPKETQNSINYAGITIDTQKHEVICDNEHINLTLKEFELLKKLLSNHGIVISRDTLLDEIWGLSFYGETRTVDAHIKTLRQKLGEKGNIIETIRGVGYKIS